MTAVAVFLVETQAVTSASSVLCYGAGYRCRACTVQPGNAIPRPYSVLELS